MSGQKPRTSAGNVERSLRPAPTWPSAVSHVERRARKWRAIGRAQSATRSLALGKVATISPAVSAPVRWSANAASAVLWRGGQMQSGVLTVVLWWNGSTAPRQNSKLSMSLARNATGRAASSRARNGAVAVRTLLSARRNAGKAITTGRADWSASLATSTCGSLIRMIRNDATRRSMSWSGKLRTARSRKAGTCTTLTAFVTTIAQRIWSACQRLTTIPIRVWSRTRSASASWKSAYARMACLSTDANRARVLGPCLSGGTAFAMFGKGETS